MCYGALLLNIIVCLVFSNQVVHCNGKKEKEKKMKHTQVSEDAEGDIDIFKVTAENRVRTCL